MFQSILANSQSLTFALALLLLSVSLALGLLVAFTALRTGACSKSFALSLVLLPAIVQVVIMMVNGNLGAGVAVVGAFSLIRFRSVPGTSRDICLIFLSMAVGLATGMGFVAYAALAAVALCGVIWLMSALRFGDGADAQRTLKITIPEDLDYNGLFDNVFADYLSGARLEAVKTTNLGSLFDLHYTVTLRDAAKEKEMIDALRCRNGNLPIVCSRGRSHSDEL